MQKTDFDIWAESLSEDQAQRLYGALDRRLHGEDHYREYLARQAFPDNVLKMDDYRVEDDE